MTQEKTLYLGNILPCLNCGKEVVMDKEIHLCNAPKNEWLNKQKKVIMIFPNGDKWDMKNKKIL